MSKGRPLTAIRRDAPESDRCTPALAPPPPGSTLGPKSTYIPASLKARTLGELARWCRANSIGPSITEAAIKDAKWPAISTWLMWGPVSLTNMLSVANLSVMLCKRDDRARLGYPNHTGQGFTSTLTTLSPDVQAEAIRVAAETLGDWKRAGSPWLTAAIDRGQSYTSGYIRQSSVANSNIQEPAE